MDQKSLELLEFPQLKQIIAGFTSFSGSRQLALDLQPLSDREEIALLLKQSAEARQLYELEPDFSIGGVMDIREAVRMAARGKVLDPPTLLEVQQTLAALAHVRGGLRRFTRELPLLWDIADGIVELRQIERDIAACLTPTGELLDSASPRLASLRRGQKEKREQLLAHLGAIIRSPRGQRIVQDPIVTEREGRYVIPIRADARKELKGIVHDVSNTGATAFVEPLTAVEHGNELRAMAVEEKQEIERILAALSARVGANEVEICQSIERVARLDLALAKAKYARRARATEPGLVPPGPDDALRLVDARHPLLGDKAVPLSVELGRDYSILVITGPNTGGKTVAMKTVGLLSLMALCGLPIPAAPESRVPLFDGVFADIGDEQSIARTLSTFSWHVGNLVRIIDRATERSLVLLDELGTSTDPAEGSALARSVLLHFLSHGTMVVATTHYGDLKAFAHATPGLQNASLDFDPVTLTPTYHLTVGVPGGSNALATAERLGLPVDIVERARGMLSKGTQELDALLLSIAAEKHKVEGLRKELTGEREKLTRQNSELESEKQRLRTEERHLLQEARDTITSEAAELQRAIRQSEADLRRERSREKIEQARRALASVQAQLKTATWQPPAPVGVTPDETVRPGDEVWLRETHLRATVLSVSEDTGQVEVQAGAARLTLNLERVEKAAVTSSGAAISPQPRRPLPGRAVPAELDLRGKRADEVEWLLDSYLNDASLANLGQARIIHGMATGTVRSIVRDLLAHHPLVKSFRPGQRGEGGDGVTVVTL